MHRNASSIKNTQHSVLMELLDKASGTAFGNAHDFKNISSYSEFKQNVSPQDYDAIRPAIRKLKEGAENLAWPGPVQQFAVSAGTSGEGKHLPITEERLQSDRRFMRKVITAYLKQRPNIFNLAGRHLSMPGSLEQQEDLLIGEISGFTALSAPALLRLLQVADPRKLTELDFRQKFDLLLEESIDADLKVITAVPSWILTLFQQVLEKTGKSTIAEVWPNLQLLVCGGVKLANYRPHLEQLAEGLELDFIETYGASEGYIGFSDELTKTDLKMVIDNGVFFECIPDPRPDTDASSIRETLPLWEAETGVPYGLLMTTNAGLWRYTLNDIIEFTALDPLRFEVKGRINDMLDEFGEALYVYEAEEALNHVARQNNLEVGNFTISPVLADKSDIPHHRWFVQFPGSANSALLKKMADQIDRQVQEINRHYTIRRESDALGAPEVRSITQSDINNWMERNGKANAQGKLPRILETNVEKL